MTEKHLFLFGGSPPFTKELGRKFAELSQKESSRIAVLFLERAGWEEHMPIYTSVLEENGAQDFVYLPLSSNPSGDTLGQLKECTGVIICGGDTERYRECIVETEIGAMIQKLYKEGVPIAGFSAGALVTPEHCVISPHDTGLEKQLYLKGVGLLKDCVVSVHFSTWDEEENLKLAKETVNASVGYGIDEDSGVYFKNEQLVSTEGATLYIC